MDKILRELDDFHERIKDWFTESKLAEKITKEK